MQRMQEVIAVWKLDGKVTAVVTDNASNGIKAVNALRDILEPNDVTCSAHILYLSIKQALSDKEINGLCQKSGKLVAHFRHSTIASDQLTRRQELLGLPTERLTQSCPTRWRSTYQMLAKLIKHRPAIQTDATVFVCHLCTTIEVLETRLRVSEKEIETLQGVILAVKDQLQEPLKDDEHSCSPQPILTVSAASQAHSVEGAEVQQKRDHPGIVPNGGQTLQSVQEQLSPADAGTQSGEGAQRDDGGFVHASGEAQGLSEQAQDTGCIGETRRPKHGTDDEPNKRKADDHDQTQNTGRRSKKKRKENKKATCCSTPEILGASKRRPASPGWHSLSGVYHRRGCDPAGQGDSSFLGIHEPHMNSGKPSRRPLQTTGSNAPVPAVEKQFPIPEPPGTANRINIHQREIGGDVQYALVGTLHEHTQLDYSTTKGQLPTLNTPLRLPGKSSVPLTWGQHLGIAHPTVTPWQALSPSVSPELYQMVGEMVRQQMMQQHLRLPTQSPNESQAPAKTPMRTHKRQGDPIKTLKEENIVLYGVAETHLRELEEPPIDPEWQWVGCNLTGGCHKGGGVGVLWRSNTAWMPMKGPCVEHIWVSGNLLGESVLFGVVYLTVTSGAHDGNAKLLQCIAEDVKRWGADREVLLMGDFNGHIPATDGFLDYNGQLLLRCAEQLSLEIVDLRADCEGCFTWCARSSRSTIDYALVNAKLAARITQIHIDEEGQFSLGSDHNRIRPHVTSTEAWYVFAEQVNREGRRGV
ncbi:hypothetical protein HPB52_004741 [Rhipicephalus sanguineus]|uniref:Endonuclease/exonuclease/phosphatase domain-containing protein n=1 Tax=Rhipicephalus sanguineus TaxID=34632 RepID=A0A9D4PSX6_RHISA|nr:hypothetical protein HPB52_004741 [Rhipicephalus sanguineus]